MQLSLERFSFGRSLTIATLLALGVGVLAGTLVPETGGGGLPIVERVVQTVGSAWVRGLRMTILPLVVSLLVVAVLGSRERVGVGRMGGAAVGIYFSIYVALANRATAAAAPAPNSDAGADLTRRELEILQLVAEGFSNSQLAKMLWVTEQTVKFHLSNIYRKLDVANRTEASRWAQLNGLLSAESRRATTSTAAA